MRSHTLSAPKYKIFWREGSNQVAVVGWVERSETQHPVQINPETRFLCETGFLDRQIIGLATK